MSTYDFVSWRPDMFAGAAGRSVNEGHLTVEPGTTPDYRREHVVWGSESDKLVNGGYMGFGTDWTIVPASGAGDRTVPISASTSCIVFARRAVHRTGYEHEAAIRNPLVKNWVRDTMVEVLGQCELY